MPTPIPIDTVCQNLATLANAALPGIFTTFGHPPEDLPATGLSVISYPPRGKQQQQSAGYRYWLHTVNVDVMISATDLANDTALLLPVIEPLANYLRDQLGLNHWATQTYPNGTVQTFRDLDYELKAEDYAGQLRRILRLILSEVKVMEVP